MITFVTAFLCGEPPKRAIDSYVSHFRTLAATGVPIVLFLDEKTGWGDFPSNVRVIHTCLSDTWIGNAIPAEVELPQDRNAKDTREYMVIQNSKTELVLRASQENPFQTDWFAWIDFGIGHVFRNPEATFERIRTLMPPRTPCIRTAGIWGYVPNDLFAGICWRYAGGFFLAHRCLLVHFHMAAQVSVHRNLPKFAWEVNAWADVERNGFDLGWFQANHDDTIIPSQETLLPPEPDHADLQPAQAE